MLCLGWAGLFFTDGDKVCLLRKNMQWIIIQVNQGSNRNLHNDIDDGAMAFHINLKNKSVNIFNTVMFSKIYQTYNKRSSQRIKLLF